MYPRRIFQTWKTDVVPDRWASSPASIRRHMPDHAYTLMTDEMNHAFVARHFPDFLPTFDGFPHGIQRADAIRYMLLHRHGGIYFDLDMALQGPVGPAIDRVWTDTTWVALVRSSNVGSCTTNSFMVARPGWPGWLDCLEEMKKPLPFWAVGKHWTVLNSTGPMMLDRVVRRRARTGRAAEVAWVPSDLILPCSVCEPTESCSRTGALVLPLEGQSWVAADTAIYNALWCRRTEIILGFLFLLALVLLLVLLRRHR